MGGVFSTQSRGGHGGVAEFDGSVGCFCFFYRLGLLWELRFLRCEFFLKARCESDVD